MSVFIVILCFILSYLAAYTMAMQTTTLALGRLLAGTPKSYIGTGVQDAITPKAQTRRNILMFALIVAIFLLTALSYAWYHGIWIIIVCFVGSYLLRLILGLQPGSPKLVTAISRDLERRHKAYDSAGDVARAHAISMLLERLRALSRTEIEREVAR